MNIIKKLVFRSLCLPVYFVANLVPKRKSVWVFGCWQGQKFSDNSRSLAIYCFEKEPGVNVVWIYKDASVKDELYSVGIPGYHYRSLKGIFYQMVAGVAFVTHTVEDDLFGPAVGRKTTVIQLWHGTPLKKILYDDMAYHRKVSSYLVMLSRKLFPWTSDRWDWVISPSNFVSETLRSAFRTSNVTETGYPRNDGFAHSKIGLGPKPIRNIIYMPTFRGGYGSSQMDEQSGAILKEFGFDFHDLNVRLKEIDCFMTIRLHPSVKIPNDILCAAMRYDRIRFDEERKDIYSLIDFFDLLITDYSSIVFDFVLTGKPVIMFGLDLERYLLYSREMYYDFVKLSPTADLSSWDGVLDFIEECKCGGLTPAYIAKYNNILNLFNKWADGESSRRVAEFAKSEIGMIS